MIQAVGCLNDSLCSTVCMIWRASTKWWCMLVWVAYREKKITFGLFLLHEYKEKSFCVPSQVSALRKDSITVIIVYYHPAALLTCTRQCSVNLFCVYNSFFVPLSWNKLNNSDSPHKLSPSRSRRWVRGCCGFSFRLGRLNNLCIIMCRTTENGSNWHLIFPPSHPLTELHLNNLDSGAHTPRDKCVLEKRAVSLLIWEKMTHIHCQTHIHAVTDTKSFLLLSGVFIFIAFPVVHLSRRRLSGHQHLETWSFLCWLIWMLIHWFCLNYEKYLNCCPTINVDNKTQQRVSHELSMAIWRAQRTNVV